MTEEKTSGLLLQSIPYLGQKKIFKVLTPHGLITLMTRSPLTPFAIAEFVYRKTQKEIHTLLDSTLIDPLLDLRQSYTILTAAGSIAQDLLRTQLPSKPAPYTLACAYLKKLPLNPPILVTSFRLKLLLHEGLLSEPDPAFSPTEWEQIAPLAFARTFSEMQEIKNAPIEKVRALFEERINR